MFPAPLGLVKPISEQGEHTLIPAWRGLFVFNCHSASTGFGFGRPLPGWWWRGVWPEAEESRSKNGSLHVFLLDGW